MTKPTPERESRGVVAEAGSVDISASKGRAMTDTVVNATAGDELDLDAEAQSDAQEIEAPELDVPPVPRAETEAEAAERKAREKADVDEALAELWRSFKDTKDIDLRERLILHYSPLVKYVAGRVGV